MKQLMARIHAHRGTEFQRAVVALFSDSSKFTLKTNVKRLGKLRLQIGGQDLGDIDILVADKLAHRLLVIECKNINPARTPYELHNEILDLTKDKPGKPSIIHRHEKRIIWAHNHLGPILVALGLQDIEAWTVEPLIVTSEPLPATYSTHTSIPTVSVDQLKRCLET